MLVDVVLILHVSLTTKITVTFTTIYFNISPWRQKNREALSPALQPIRLITGRIVTGRHCILDIILGRTVVNLQINMVNM